MPRKVIKNLYELFEAAEKDTISNRKEEIQSSSDIVYPGDISETEVDISDWLLYQNEEYGFQLQYPPEWGDVVEREGISVVLPAGRCFPGGLASMFCHGGRDDMGTVFEGAPIEVGIRVVKLAPEPKNRIWSYPEGYITLEDDRLEIEGGDRVGAYTNDQDIKVYRAVGEDYYSIVETHRLYGSGFALEGRAQFSPYRGTPEEIDYRKYDCLAMKRTNNCGLLFWLEHGLVSGEVREAFKLFSEMMNGIKLL